MRKINKIIYRFLHLPIGGKLVRCPYMRTILQPNMIRIPGPFFVCKKSPNEIVKIVEKRADKLKINLKKLTKREILKFMKEQRVGIDCSGFVYWALDAFYRDYGKRDWMKKMILAVGKSKNPARRLNVATLTGEINSVEVKMVKDIQPGDLIRLNFGDVDGDGLKHVMILTGVGQKILTYYHSGTFGKTKGVHKGVIKIVDFEAGLEKQVWLEKTKDGENFGEKYFCPEAGDKVVRLKV